MSLLKFLFYAFSLYSVAYAFSDQDIQIDKIVYPTTTINNLSNIPKNIVYNLQYNNNSIWVDTNYMNESFGINYNYLITYKKYLLRYKFIKHITNEISYSNNFSLAYINLDYTLYKNNNTLYLNWENINFVSNNSLHLEFFYNNKTNSHLKFKKINIKNTHIINMTELIYDHFIFDFILIVKSNKYPIENRININHNELVKIVTKNKHNSLSFCINRYCNMNLKKNWQVCINNNVYPSICYALCNKEIYNSVFDFKKCNMTTITSSSTITTSSSTITTSSSTITTSSSTITTSSSNITTSSSIKEIQKKSLNLNNFELVFSGIQSCINNKRCNNATRFSTAKRYEHTNKLIIHSNLSVTDCLLYCEEDYKCKGIYIFYTDSNGFRCRTLSYLGTSIGTTTVLYDFSFKFIGNRTTLTTPTSTPTSTQTSSTNLPTSVPLTNLPTSVPLTNLPTSVPFTNLPTSVPFTNLPTTVPLTNLPTTVPLTNLPTSVPLTNLPTTVPLTNLPTTVPLTNLPTSVPLTNLPTTVPLTNLPTTVPLTNLPTSVPLTNLPTTVPLTNLPTSVPLTNLPTRVLSNNITGFNTKPLNNSTIEINSKDDKILLSDFYLIIIIGSIILLLIIIFLIKRVFRKKNIRIQKDIKMVENSRIYNNELYDYVDDNVSQDSVDEMQYKHIYNISENDSTSL